MRPRYTLPLFYQLSLSLGIIVLLGIAATVLTSMWPNISLLIWLSLSILVSAGVLEWMRRTIVQPLHQINQQLTAFSKNTKNKDTVLTTVTTVQEFQQLQTSIEGLGQTLAQSRKTAKELSSNLKTTRAELQTYRVDLRNTRTELKDMRSDLAKEISSNLKTTRAEVQTYRVDLRNTRTELKDMRSDLKDSRHLAGDLFDEVRWRRIQAVEQEIRQLETNRGNTNAGTILFFNATSGPGRITFNATAGLLLSWMVRVAGHAVKHVVCNHGMVRCIQGTYLKDLDKPPPCERCFEIRSGLFPADLSLYLEPSDLATDGWMEQLQAMSLDDLVGFRYQDIELGALCLPAVRWALRRHDLTSFSPAHQVFADYVRSGIAMVERFEHIFSTESIQAVVAFNGTFFPEAILRALAQRHGIPVITYEVGFRSNSLFLSHEVATAYPIQVPADFVMTEAQTEELNQYLSQRMQGQFTMGGVSFWPEMLSIEPTLKSKIEQAKQVVLVFTNVIFDTSQIYANAIFDHMFDWLQETIALVSQSDEALVIVRAHPDEARGGRESQEPIATWIEQQGYGDRPNVVFIPPTEYVSSYELIRLCDFCVVYNSTIGIEATLLGKPVITGGHTRYDNQHITHSAANRQAFLALLQSFLAEGPPPLPPDWQQRAQRFMYYSLFKASLDLSAFVTTIPEQDFSIAAIRATDLQPNQSQEMQLIYDGIVADQPFHYP